MQRVKNSTIEWLPFLQHNQAIIGSSTRIGGKSTGKFQSLNLGLNTQDNVKTIEQNRTLFFNTIAPKMHIVYLNQTHSSCILDADAPNFKNFSAADGIFTTQKNKLLCITIADCGSVLFCDEAFTVVCAIHCGWRGVKDGIIQNALKILSEKVDLSTVSAYLGPMIRCAHYEVGKEFLGYFSSEYFSEKNGKLYFDLNNLIINSLLRGGIGSVQDCGYDTFATPELFFSYRRDANTGRMCTFIGLK